MAIRTLRLLVILAATLIASEAISAQREFDRRFNVVPGGHLRLDTDIGSVAVIGGTGRESRGGYLDVRNVTAPVRGTTSGGSISVADAKGDLDVHTSGGGIQLKDIDASVRAATSGGSVHAEIRSNRGISLSTSGGAISLLLPENARASIDARTSGGRVTSALSLSSTETDDRSHLRGAINGGGEQVVLHTSGGSIRLGPLFMP